MLDGKRINYDGNLGTVEKIDGITCIIKYDDYNTRGRILTSVVKDMPEVVSRASFDYKPGR